MRTIFALCVAAIVLTSLSTPSTSAWPGNIVSQVNYNAVLDGQVRLCNASVQNLPSGYSDWAISSWNSAVPVGLTSACTGTHIHITDVVTGGCGFTTDGTPYAACALHPYQDDRVDVYQHVTDMVRIGWPGDATHAPIPPFTDSQKRTVAVHETGHNLGFDHQCGGSIMSNCASPDDPYQFTTPQTPDVNNYREAYTVLPPYNFVPSSSAGGQVELAWEQALIWNEANFAVYRRNPQGTYDWIATALKNAVGVLLTNQPTGPQIYRVGGFTRADCVLTGGFCAASGDISVNVTALGRVSNLTLDANSSSSITLTWSALAGAVTYEVCRSGNPNDAPGAWTCANVNSVTSTTVTIPSTSTKAVWYYAVRGVASNGTKGTLSNRGALSRFNEPISGVTYNSYHTVYKSSSATKRVNGYNRGSSSRYLVFNNGSPANNKSKLVSGNSKMYTSASSWSVSDNNGAFGPFVTTVESPNSSFLPQDSITVSTICMTISGSCN